jgi:hypothetical protein
VRKWAVPHLVGELSRCGQWRNWQHPLVSSSTPVLRIDISVSFVVVVKLQTYTEPVGAVSVALDKVEDSHISEQALAILSFIPSSNFSLVCS